MGVASDRSSELVERGSDTEVFVERAVDQHVQVIDIFVPTSVGSPRLDCAHLTGDVSGGTVLGTALARVVAANGGLR